MEHHDPVETSSSTVRQSVSAEDPVIDQDPPPLDEAPSQDGIHVPVRLDLEVWRWLLAQGGDYHARITILLRAQMDAGEARER